MTEHLGDRDSRPPSWVGSREGGRLLSAGFDSLIEWLSRQGLLTSKVTVPDFRGLSFTETTELARQSGVRVRPAPAPPGTTGPPGIIAQGRRRESG
jgi:hypothetical protein